MKINIKIRGVKDHKHTQEPGQRAGHSLRSAGRGAGAELGREWDGDKAKSLEQF